jgi:hemolysin D
LRNIAVRDFDELAKAEQKAAGFAQDVIKAEQRTKLLALTAPVDGVVQRLAVHTIGGVVTPAQALLAVVPLDSHLEIEAMVSNRDIGFVHADQHAEINARGAPREIITEATVTSELIPTSRRTRSR